MKTMKAIKNTGWWYYKDTRSGMIVKYCPGSAYAYGRRKTDKPGTCQLLTWFEPFNESIYKAISDEEAFIELL